MARPPITNFPRRSIPRESAAWDTQRVTTTGTVVSSGSSTPVPEQIRVRCIVQPGSFGAAPTGAVSTVKADGIALADGDYYAYDNGLNIYSGLYQYNSAGAHTRIYATYHRRGQLFTVWDTNAGVHRAQTWIFEIDTETFTEGVTQVYIHREPHDDKGLWKWAGVHTLAPIAPGGYQWLQFPTILGTQSEYANTTNVNFYQVDLAGCWTVRISIKQNVLETIGMAITPPPWPFVEYNIHKIAAATVLPVAPALGTVVAGVPIIDTLAAPYQYDVRHEGTLHVDLARGDRIAISQSNVAGFAPFITPIVTDCLLEMSIGPRR